MGGKREKPWGRGWLALRSGLGARDTRDAWGTSSAGYERNLKNNKKN